jgi:hypothetical protein
MCGLSNAIMASCRESFVCVAAAVIDFSLVPRIRSAEPRATTYLSSPSLQFIPRSTETFACIGGHRRRATAADLSGTGCRVQELCLTVILLLLEGIKPGHMKSTESYPHL